METMKTYRLYVGAEAKTMRRVGAWTRSLTAALEKALTFAIEGTSQRTAASPDWLRPATDVNLRDLHVSKTAVNVEMPELGSVMKRARSAYDGFPRVPASQETALSVLHAVFQDVARVESTTPHFDAGVLDSVQVFLNTIDGGSRPVSETIITPLEEHTAPSNAVREPQPTSEPPSWSQRVADLIGRMPSRQKLDFRATIQGTAWTRSFWMDVDGIPVRGRAESTQVFGDAIADWERRDVFLTGVCSFSPDGTPMYVEAHRVEPYDADAHAPFVVPMDKIRKRAREKRNEERQKGTDGHVKSDSTAYKTQDADEARDAEKWPPDHLKGIWGVLDGDETMDDLLNALDD